MAEVMLYELLVIFALVLANGVLSGAEIAVIALRRTRLQELVAEGKRSALAVQALRDQPERFLATVQIGITLVTATAAAFGGATLGDELLPLLERVPLLRGHADKAAIAIVVVTISFLSIVVGELVPKSLALRGAEAYALAVGRPLLALSWIARPVVWLLTLSSNLILRPFGDRTTFTEARLSKDELAQLLEEATKTGAVEELSGEIASRALTFGELTAKDVMVPRNRIHALALDASDSEVRRVLLEERHSRMPVFDGSLDRVVGYIAVTDVVAMIWERQVVVLDDLVRPAFFVPETASLTTVLKDLQRRRIEIAVVVDEHGGVAGLLTLEDLMEELVGEIFSEHAPPAPLIEHQADGSAIVSGDVTIRELNRALGVSLDADGPWTTVAGLAIAVAGRIPQRGAHLNGPSGLDLEVLDAAPNQVHRLKVRLVP